jgi:hypothetical protein
MAAAAIASTEEEEAAQKRSMWHVGFAHNVPAALEDFHVAAEQAAHEQPQAVVLLNSIKPSKVGSLWAVLGAGRHGTKGRPAFCPAGLPSCCACQHGQASRVAAINLAQQQHISYASSLTTLGTAADVARQSVPDKCPRGGGGPCMRACCWCCCCGVASGGGPCLHDRAACMRVALLPVSQARHCCWHQLSLCSAAAARV